MTNGRFDHLPHHHRLHNLNRLDDDVMNPYINTEARHHESAEIELLIEEFNEADEDDKRFIFAHLCTTSISDDKLADLAFKLEG